MRACSQVSVWEGAWLADKEAGAAVMAIISRESQICEGAGCRSALRGDGDWRETEGSQREEV